MMTVAWLVAIGALVALFSGVIERRNNPNAKPVISRADGVVEVTLKRNRQGHYVAPGTINGQPVQFLLDTGASLVSMPLGLAQELGVPRGRALKFDTANGVSDGYMTRLESVAIGGIELTDVAAGVTTGMGGSQVLLGMNFLKSLELVQSGDSLMLRLSASPG